MRVEARPYRLINTIQPYVWGEEGPGAFIPSLLGQKGVPGEHYAELWMGAHPKAPSQIVLEEGPVSLADVISEDPEGVLGAAVAARFDARLPFLFKVLSAGRALSIQAHPDKAQAEVLHRADPEHYPDDNHKPEIAIALDSLHALAGVKSAGDLSAMLQKYSEIGQLLSLAGTESPSPFHALLESATAYPEAMKTAIDRLIERFADPAHALDEAESLFVALAPEYPEGDVGLLAIFFLQYRILAPGEALFLDAGVPHAYVKGNIIECMANSDNVVRVGLTPKFKDVESLLRLMDCRSDAVLSYSDVSRYVTPALEFMLERHCVGTGSRMTVENGGQAAVMLVLEGTGSLQGNEGMLAYKTGDVFMLPAVCPRYTLNSIESTEIYCAGVPTLPV